MESLRRFGKSFQEELCQLILEDRSFCDQMEEVEVVKYLELKYLQVFTQLIMDYRDKYKSHPTYGTMKTMVKAGLVEESPTIKEQLRKYYARVLAGDVKGNDFTRDKALDFCKKQVLKEAMIKSVELLKRSTTEYDQIQKMINDALNKGVDNKFGHDWHKDLEQRYVTVPRNPQSTGWPRIDEITQGGLGKRELAVVIAPTGAGKSMVLTHIGSKAIMDGKTVIHYTLELADAVIGQRYDSCITGVQLGDLMANKERIQEIISEIDGELIIKEYPAKSASTNTIMSHIEKMRKRGIEPDMVIVDYADLLRPVRHTAEKRHDLENIYEELRAIGQTYDIPVVTASQTNRSGLNAEVITMESISEAFNKCFVADFIISLSRTTIDKQSNQGRVFVAKNRNGPDGIIYPAFVDWTNVKIKVLQPNNSEEELVAPTTTEALTFLKEKYQRLRK